MKIPCFPLTPRPRAFASARQILLWIAFAGTLTPRFEALADTLSSNVQAQITALYQEKALRTPAQQKMDSQLVYGLKRDRSEVIAPEVPNLRIFLPERNDGKVEVDITATVSQDLLKFITTSGGTVINNFPKFDAIRAVVPFSQLEALAGRSDVKFIEPAAPMRTLTGSVDSEGDTTLKAIQARSSFGVDGSGVKVGVISSSVDFLSNSQSTGDLPDVTVLPGQSGVPSTGEGTAMLEIIADIAPGAQLFFATGNGGVAGFAQNVLALKDAGCDIIVDDIIYGTEAVFQDGAIARAVNSVTANGALFFSACGNFGNQKDQDAQVWEGDFVDGGAIGAPITGSTTKPGNVHSFGAVTYETFTAVAGGMYLWWADPLNASTNDYDLFILDNTGANVLGASTTVQNGTQSAIEGLVGGIPPGLRAVVVKTTSAAPRFLHVTGWGNGATISITTHGNIVGHCAATNAFAVGATDVHNSYPNAFTGGSLNPVETFSSDGPRRMFFQADGTAINNNFTSAGGAVRAKPDITCADGVTTTVPGFAPFFGTSAAAPHAAAIAALLKSYNAFITPDQVRNVFTNSTLDIEAPGWDENSGAGIVMADLVLANAPLPIPLPRFVIKSETIFGGNGNGVIDTNECSSLNIVVTNGGRALATGVRATLSTTTPGVIIAQPTVSYPAIDVGASGTNFTPFKISTAPFFVCGTPIDLELNIKSDQISSTNRLQLASGVPGTPLRFDNAIATPIPDNDLKGVSSIITVSNVSAALEKVTVLVQIDHTYDSDISLALVSPGGFTNVLSANHGGAGQNYGLACTPDNQRTTFDDAATNTIANGAAPYTGTFRPDQALSQYNGTSGTNVNGAWQLHVVDSAAGDVGTINCWSLILTPAACANGGGECPGSDMSVVMSALPEPVVLGNYLTYTFTVVNNGPSGVQNGTLTHVLPSSAIFVSASSSQGSYSQSGGVVTFSFGPVVARGTVTASVTVLPTTAGVLSSSATVASEQPDFNPANNSATFFSHVNPATTDLAVGMSGAPSSLVIGAPLTYTISATNNGPSTASIVSVTNVIPANMLLTGETVSQGSVSVYGNVVVCNFGALTNGATASATIYATPTAEGTFVATASISGNQVDPIPGNNTASVSTIVGPASDLVLTAVGNPDSVVTHSNLTYRITITNAGPSTATGVGLSGTLPASVTVVSNYSSLGPLTISGGAVSCAVSNLAKNVGGVVIIVVSPNLNGTITANFSVSGTLADPLSLNNSASVSTLVAPPFINIIGAGAILTQESGPTNGAVDIGETVTASLYLENAGNVKTTNLVATLLATNGITPYPPNAPQHYNVVSPGTTANRPFKFTANGTNGQVVSAVLAISDGATGYSNVTYNFTLPSTFTFSNSSYIAIRDNTSASPYPSTIHVSGMSGVVGKVTATLYNAAHTFPQDIDTLLVAPGGQNSILMAGAGAPPLDHVNITFDDAAASVIPDGTQTIATGSYRPANYAGLSLPSPAPASPYPAALAIFNAINPNGDWSLFVDDHTAGDTGSIAGGWAMTFTVISPVNQLADLGLSVAASPNPCLLGNNWTNVFTISNAGAGTASLVTFTNPLPAGTSLFSASSSLGNSSLVISPTGVGCNVGALPTGSNVTVTIVLTPSLANVGSLVNTATVANQASETDPDPVNNTASATTTVNRPLADLTLNASIAPNPIYVGASQTNSFAITNLGPNTALNVVLNNSLPAGAGFVAASSTPGGVVVGQSVVYTLGNLSINANAAVTLVFTNSIAGTITNITQLITDSTDVNPANNSVTNVVTVLPPAPVIVVSGQILTSESGPVNGAIDPGERVTMLLSLRNIGTLDSANLTATLAASGGVTQTDGVPRSYGTLVRNGAAGSNSFVFTAANVNGGLLIGTLQLTNNGAFLGTVSFTNNLSGTTAFVSTNQILIPDHGVASPYPSTITVSGLAGQVGKATVTLNGLTHSFPHDVNVLLVSPAGSSVLLMSHTGGGHPLTNATLAFDDAAATLLSNTAQISSSTNKPSIYPGAVSFPSPAPGSGYGSALAAVSGGTPNGVWSLYVLDDSVGDSGNIANGWSLSLTTVSPLNPITDLAIGMTGTPSSAYVGKTVTYNIGVTNLGPLTANGVTVGDVLPGGVSLVSSTASQGTISVFANAVTWSLNQPLAVGSSATLSLVTAPSLAGTIVNTATVSGLESDLDQANNSAQVTTTVASPVQAVLSASIVNNEFHMTVTAQPGFEYLIQAKMNLLSPVWVTVSTNTASASGIIKYTNTDAPNLPYRFYRTKQQ